MDTAAGAAVGDADDYSDYYAEDEYEYYDEDCLDEVMMAVVMMVMMM